MVASNRLSGRHEDHIVAIPGSGERVVRAAVLYGANGAGKSNLFKALRYMRSVALEPRASNNGTGRYPFRFGLPGKEPSAFYLQFIASDKLYRLGFKIDDERVLEEWLVHIDGGRENTLYERITSDGDNVAVLAPGLAGAKVKALAVIGGPPNQSFLATIRATLRSADFGDAITHVVDWLENALSLISPDESLGHMLTQRPDLHEFASGFLKAASTGIDHLVMEKDEISRETFTKLLTERFTAQGVEGPRTGDKDGLAVYELGDGDLLVAEHNGSNCFYRVRIRAAHEKQSGESLHLDIKEESDGTRRLLHLIPALGDVRADSAVYFIDEIDRSLHPMLVRNFIEFFLKSCGGTQRQLIMTTHESNLLDQELLRRDEIWFAEKDQAGATHLYSLMDFKVRNDLEIRKHYLQGRFGAVPFLGDLTRLPVDHRHPV